MRRGRQKSRQHILVNTEKTTLLPAPKFTPFVSSLTTSFAFPPTKMCSVFSLGEHSASNQQKATFKPNGTLNSLSPTKNGVYFFGAYADVADLSTKRGEHRSVNNSLSSAGGDQRSSCVGFAWTLVVC
jgi:hypothetical protein